MSGHVNSKRGKLMVSVGTAMSASLAVGGLVAAPVLAADADVIPPSAPTPTPSSLEPFVTVGAHDVVDAVLSNVAAVSAKVVGTKGGVGTETDGTTKTSIAVTGNDVQATAIGNKFDNSIALSLTANTVGGDGEGALGVTLNTGTITATVGARDVDASTLDKGDDPNRISIDLSNFKSGSVAASGNTIEADASANDGTTSIAGAIPNTYTSTEAGTATATHGVPSKEWLDASGSLLAGTVQISTGDAVNAYALNNQVALDLTSTGNNTITGAPALDDNMIAANARGNSSNSMIDIQSGGAPTFAGSAVVSNGQFNSAGINARTDNPGDPIGGGGYAYVSSILATIDSSALGDSNLLSNGSLSVNGNTISTSASGNQALGKATGEAGNQIVLANGLSFTGAASTLSGAASNYLNSTMQATTSADIVILNSQGNVGASDGSRTYVQALTGSKWNLGGTDIGALVQAINGSSVSVSDNVQTSLARGNAASNAFSTGTGTALFDGSVALSNQQANVYADIWAVTDYAALYANVSDPATEDTLPESSVAADDNTQSAAAYGNSASQSVMLTAATLTFPDSDSDVQLSGGTGTNAHVSNNGGATITNLQSMYNSDVTTRLFRAYISVAGDPDGSVLDSSLEAADNTQEAIAVGDSASNALSVTATTGATGAGLASVQIVANDLDIDATSDALVQAVAGYTGATDGATDLGDSSLAVGGNLDRAIAYGASAGNTLALGAQTLTVDTGIAGTPSTVTFTGGNQLGFALDKTSAPQVLAANGLLNIQSVQADITATARPGGFPDQVESKVLDTAYLDGIGVGGGTAFLAFVSGSAEDGSSLVNGGHIEQDLNGDDVIVGANQFVAAAYGANADNAATLTGGEITTTAVGDPDYAAVLNLTNAQTVTEGSTVAAEASGDAAVLTHVGVNLLDSSTDTSFNSIQAQAYDNLAGNTLTLDVTNVDTGDNDGRGEASVTFTSGKREAVTDARFGLNSVQYAGGMISSTLVRDGDPGTSASVLTEIGGDVTGSSVLSNSNALSAASTANRADNLLDLSANDLTTTGALTNYQTSRADISAIIGIGGTETDAGGVTAAIGGNIENSTVAVNGNSVSGSVAGNSASNAVKVDGTNVSGGSGLPDTTGTATNANTTIAAGDYMLASQQNAGHSSDTVGSTLSSKVYGTFAIDSADDTSIADSAISIDGNVQSSRAVVNSAANSVELDATDTTAGAVLVSNQTSDVVVSAASGMNVFAPVSSEGTGISMSDNQNLAMAVINNASNTLTINATNADPVASPRDASLQAVGIVADADQVLLNHQIALTSVTADAVTAIFNKNGANVDDSGAFVSVDPLVDGSVTIRGNSTSAEATGNRAVNAGDIKALASLGASTGVMNWQDNSATVASSATTSAVLTINNPTTQSIFPVALNASSVMLDGNSTSALARGNMAANVLNYSAGADYGSASGTPASAEIDALTSAATVVDARAALFNVQSNSGAVTASSIGASYVVSLSSKLGTVSVLNAAVGVTGDSVSAAAYGNTATNLLALTALNTGSATAAIGSYQANTAAVLASVTSVSYGVNGGLGAITGSALAVSGNSITATAIGNNAVSTITAK